MTQSLMACPLINKSVRAVQVYAFCIVGVSWFNIQYKVNSYVNCFIFLLFSSKIARAVPFRLPFAGGCSNPPCSGGPGFRSPPPPLGIPPPPGGSFGGPPYG